MSNKPSRSKGISDGDILALYEEILPLTYANPKGINLANRVNKLLLKFVWYDFIHYIMEDTTVGNFEGQLSASREDWGSLKAHRVPPETSVVSLQKSEAGSAFELQLKHNYTQATELAKEKYPSEKPFYYHRIISRHYPKIAVGFFRSPSRSKDFTAKDLDRFRQLRPHILRLFRAALNQACQSQTFQYFGSFARIGSRLVKQHGLSDAEVKLLPDILSGYSNEDIAKRHFLSLATVKTHIHHILKKTESKNRVDFLGKFFTSPEHVQL